MGNALCQLHKAHQQSAATQHQTGPHHCKQGVLNGVLPAQDDVPRVPCRVSEARYRAPQPSVQAVFHFQDFLIKFCSVHLTFGYVETLRKKRYDSSVILSSDLLVTVGSTDCNQWACFFFDSGFCLLGKKKSHPAWPPCAALVLENMFHTIPLNGAEVPHESISKQYLLSFNHKVQDSE